MFKRGKKGEKKVVALHNGPIGEEERDIGLSNYHT